MSLIYIGMDTDKFEKDFFVLHCTRLQERIAKLEKERDEHMAHAYYILETCMVFSPAHFEAHNLEQQAKGINELVAHLKVNTSYLMFTESTFREVESYYDFLLDQAKALKEGK